MGIFDSAKDKANEFLNSDAGEKKSDEFLDKASDAASARFGEDKRDHINKARDAVDGRVGNNNDGAERPEENPNE